MILSRRLSFHTPGLLGRKEPSVIVKLRSKRLSGLFTEVWERLPAADQALLSSRTRLIVDDPVLLPKNQRAILGAVMVVSVRKSITLVYLSPRKLPRQSDSFVRGVIANLLAQIFCGHPDQDSTEFESEANERVRGWGFPGSTDRIGD